MMKDPVNLLQQGLQIYKMAHVPPSERKKERNKQTNKGAAMRNCGVF
jgi:hypothetical protein